MLTPIALLVAASIFPTVPADPTSPKMLAALDVVKADEIKKDVYFIAGDELAGRDTPSEGLRVAARYLRSRLERLGWKPGAKDGYFYEYPLELKVIDETASRVRWKAAGGASGELVAGKDYFLASLSDLKEVTTEAAVVFAGSGSKDDFGSSRAEGKWALVFDEGTELSSLARNARKAKAKGLIVAPGPNYAGEDYVARFTPALEKQRRGEPRYPTKPEAAKGKKAKEPKGDEAAAAAEERTSFENPPMFALTRAAAVTMLEGAQKPATPAKGADLGLTLTETRELAGENGRIQVENVCGFWPGSDPVLSKECVILSAHYDHVGVMRGQIHNGADDNGSGTCLMLAVAEALAQHGPLKRSVMIMWVSGEEKGLWGSKAFSENPWFPEGVKPVADINIDMVGRNGPEKLLVTPTKAREKDHNGLVELAEKLAPLEGFPKLGNADQYYERSDHYMFAKLGIPVMFLFSDVHEDYHAPGDDPEKLDYDKIHRVARLVLRMLDGLDDKRQIR